MSQESIHYAYTFDDLLLLPGASSVLPSEVDLSTRLTRRMSLNRCESCGVQFERQQSFTDAPLKICPECRKRSLKKVISPVRVVFKGSGFYSTDHRPSAASSTPPEKAEKKSDSSLKSDSKSSSE